MASTHWVRMDQDIYKSQKSQIIQKYNRKSVSLLSVHYTWTRGMNQIINLGRQSTHGAGVSSKYLRDSQPGKTKIIVYACYYQMKIS